MESGPFLVWIHSFIVWATECEQITWAYCAGLLGVWQPSAGQCAVQPDTAGSRHCPGIHDGCALKSSPYDLGFKP